MPLKGKNQKIDGQYQIRGRSVWDEKELIVLSFWANQKLKQLRFSGGCLREKKRTNFFWDRSSNSQAKVLRSQSGVFWEIARHNKRQERIEFILSISKGSTEIPLNWILSDKKFGLPALCEPASACKHTKLHKVQPLYGPRQQQLAQI